MGPRANSRNGNGRTTHDATSRLQWGAERVRRRSCVEPVTKDRGPRPSKANRPAGGSASGFGSHETEYASAHPSLLPSGSSPRVWRAGTDRRMRIGPGDVKATQAAGPPLAPRFLLELRVSASPSWMRFRRSSSSAPTRSRFRTSPPTHTDCLMTTALKASELVRHVAAEWTMNHGLREPATCVASGSADPADHDAPIRGGRRARSAAIRDLHPQSLGPLPQSAPPSRPGPQARSRARPSKHTRPPRERGFDFRRHPAVRSAEP